MGGMKKPADKKRKKKQKQPASSSSPPPAAQVVAVDENNEHVTVELDADTASAYQAASSLLQWMNDQVSQEAARITARGCRALPLEVQRISVERRHIEAASEAAEMEGKQDGALEITNVITVDTNFDFDLIKQIVISEDPLPCGPRPDLAYLNVGCLTDKPLPLLMPFVFKQEPENRLDRWCFVNASGRRSLHVIDSFRSADG